MMENAYDNPVATEDQSYFNANATSNASETQLNFQNSASTNNTTSDNLNDVFVIALPPSKLTNPQIEFSCQKTQEKSKVNSIVPKKYEKQQEINLKIDNCNSRQQIRPISEKAGIDYDPYQHIQQKNPTSYWDTTFHLLKASLGTGILAMPNAFHNAGYAVGLVGTLIIGFLCTYNMHILVSSEYELCRRKKVPSMTYPETVQAAFEEGPSKLKWFAPYGRFVTNLFLVTYQIGTSSIYLVFIASNLKDIYDTYYNTDISVRLMTFYLLAPSVLISWIRNLKLLVPFSTIANAATMLSFVLIFRYVFDGLPSLADRQPVGTIRGIPLFFGTVLFAMEAIGVVMPLKNQMKKPQKFSSLFGVLNASMLPISLMYAFIGFFGYLKYGDSTEGSVTLNLPRNELLAQGVKVLYSSSIFITYALSNYVSFDIIWNNGIKSKINASTKTRIFWEYLVRTLIVIFTLFLAVAVPNLEIFISFVGAFCLSSIGVAFPAIVQILVFWCNHDDKLQFSAMVFKNVIIIMIAVLAFTIGVSTSVLKFYNEMT